VLDKGLVRIIDLAVVSKDENGHVTIFDANELSADVAPALVKLDVVEAAQQSMLEAARRG
jgi:hypothetical protein